MKKNKDVNMDGMNCEKQECACGEKDCSNAENIELTNEESVMSECDKLKKELEIAQDFAKRTKADMENMKKRNQNLAQEMYLDGKLETLTLLLPVIDSFDRALDMELPENLKEGILKIKKQFDSVIEKLGVEEIAALGEQFTPNLHNALMQVEDADNSGKIVNVYEKGYKFKDKILRHASVVVAK